MESIYFLDAVYRARIQTFGSFGRVLDLETRFYVFYWSGDEGDGCAGHYSCHGVAEGGEFVYFGGGEGRGSSGI